MQRSLFLLLLLLLACGVFAEGDTATAVPAPPTDSLVNPSPDSSSQVAAPSLDTLPATTSVLSPEQLAALKEEMSRDKARRDSVRAAREEAASSVEWHAVGDSGAPSVATQAAPELRAAPSVVPDAAVTTRSSKPRLPIPEVPQEKEPKVLMWVGLGLVATALEVVAFLHLTRSSVTSKEEVDLNPVTDPTAGNSDAKTEKTMTIRWSH